MISRGVAMNGARLSNSAAAEACSRIDENFRFAILDFRLEEDDLNLNFEISDFILIQSQI
jgi:hypothetical protein